MHLLFSVFSFLSAVNLEPDELHILHLGVSQYFGGSILYLLVFVVLEGSTKENLEAVWQAIMNHYTARKTSSQYSNFQL